jgi:molybdate transport system substrate-binding protein
VIRPRILFIALLCLPVVILGACGDDSDDKPTIKVSAAASLKDAFEAYAKDFDAADVSYSFAGSDELAAQIKAGARPDVYAAANTKLPDELYADGLVEKPVSFATNTLVIAVPADRRDEVNSLGDLAKQGVTIAAGSETVPVGSYTRKVLSALPPVQEQAILDNIKSNEPDVAGVVGKVSQGAVDAGFVYITDVKGGSGKLRSVSIPSDLQPTVVYGAAVVKGTGHAEQASDFVQGLTSGAGADALRAAGFGPAPES